MFCPGCGTKNSIEQSFCRTCGMNLEQSAASMRDQLPTARQQLLAEERRLETFGKFVFTGFGLVVGAGALGFIYWIFVKMVLSGTQPIAGVLLMVFIVFAGLALGYVLWAESLKEKRKRVNEISQPERLDSPPTGRDLELGEPARAGFIQSVVEDTTRSLDRHRTHRLD